MNSRDLVKSQSFIPLSDWIEVGQYILRQVTKAHIPQDRLPNAPVVCAMRYCGDASDLAKIGYVLSHGKSDILYIGHSSQLGIEEGKRIYNMRYNNECTNQNIRDEMAKIYGALSGRVEIGWLLCENNVEALRISSKIKNAFRDEHGRLPLCNGRR